MVLSMERWLGKVAIVTGVSSGIGAAIASALASEGLIVIGLARRAPNLKNINLGNLIQPGKIIHVETDISNEDSIKSTLEWVKSKIGLVHVLVNNAGTSRETSLMKGSTEDWKDILDVNVLGLSITTREVIQVMRENNIEGHIIHINSIMGHKLVNVQMANMYPASKFAVTALTETLRQELREIGSNIKITSISPGLVATEMTVFNTKISEKKLSFFKNKPLLKPEDIADGVVYVLSTPKHVQVHELTIKPVGEF